MTSQIAVVTGGNRGIGLEVCRQMALKGYHVVLTARSEEQGSAACRSLEGEGISVSFHPLDVTKDASIHTLLTYVKQTHGKLDALINNAGIFIDDGSKTPSTALESDLDTIRTTLETNTLGPFRLCQLLGPFMGKSGGGCIVNVSSGMGQLFDMTGGSPGYRLSKTALNAVTRIFAAELASQRVLVNSCCPGWVKTDMGGMNAPRDVTMGADSIVWLASQDPESGPTGKMFRNREVVPW